VETPIECQARCLRIRKKRQQAAALQTLCAYQRPLHRRQRVRNHRDQRALPCDGVAGHISQPGVAEGSGGGRAGGRCQSGDFGSGYAGLGNMRAKPPARRICVHPTQTKTVSCVLHAQSAGKPDALHALRDQPARRPDRRASPTAAAGVSRLTCRILVRRT